MANRSRQLKRRARTMMLSSSHQTIQLSFPFDDIIHVRRITSIEEIESETKRPIELTLLTGFF